MKFNKKRRKMEERNMDDDLDVVFYKYMHEILSHFNLKYVSIIQYDPYK